MASYVIGDIQGCYQSFLSLLRQIDFQPGKDTLWLVGDVINRGENSLGMLEWVTQHTDCTQMILGNHDLFFIAIAQGVASFKKGDTTQAILQAPNARALISFLRAQPLFFEDEQHAMVHAGIWPNWSLSEAKQYADAFCHELKHTTDLTQCLIQLMGTPSPTWSPDFTTMEQHRFTVNTMTRMRAIRQNGELDFHYKAGLHSMPEHLQPWFRVPRQQPFHKTLFVGHWSALGLHQENQVIALDTGCLWGGSLTAYCKETKTTHAFTAPPPPFAIKAHHQPPL
jgi:bis(5'-nucleosyl)-tetraphosphatase (symmetrical)